MQGLDGRGRSSAAVTTRGTDSGVSALRTMFEKSATGRGELEPAAPRLLVRPRTTAQEKETGEQQAPASATHCVLNSEGNPAALGRHPQFTHVYYCAQRRDIPGSDGVCGDSPLVSTTVFSLS
jgi:hypothetical protein